MARTAMGLWGAGSRVRSRLQRLTLFWKVIIGNSLIMGGGAIAGTWVTKTLVEQSNFQVATILVVAGISLSMIMNFAIMRAAFKPLQAIEKTVEEVSRGNVQARVPGMDRLDPDILRLAQTMNMMLDRLDQGARTIELHSRQIQVMSAQVLNAQEEERRRIARELHDETSQALNALLLSLDMVHDAAPEGATEARMRLDASKELAMQTLDSIHQLAFDLRPTILDDLGLGPSIRWYAKRQSETYGLQILVSVDELGDRLSPHTEVALFRVLQEALTNVAKHASASLVRVTLKRSASTVELSVQDNGVGFEPGRVSADRLGLFGMQERAGLIGGHFELETKRGRGTRITVITPIEEQTTRPRSGPALAILPDGGSRRERAWA